MKIGWFGLNDEEYIEQIRRCYQGLHRWKWWIACVIAILVSCCIALWVMIARLASHDLILNPPTPFNTYSQGLVNGFLFGVLFAFVLPSICLAVPTLLMELRTWKLLLDYHDRMQQAGLLPEGLADETASFDLPPVKT